MVLHCLPRCSQLGLESSPGVLVRRLIGRYLTLVISMLTKIPGRNRAKSLFSGIFGRELWLTRAPSMPHQTSRTGSPDPPVPSRRATMGERKPLSSSGGFGDDTFRFAARRAWAMFRTPFAHCALANSWDLQALWQIRSTNRASGSCITKQSPRQAAPSHVAVERFTENILDRSALLDRQHFQAFPAILGQSQCNAGQHAIRAVCPDTAC